MGLHQKVFFPLFSQIPNANDIGPSLQEVAIEKVLQHERRVVEEEESHRIEPNASDDTTPWLRFTQWKGTFRGKDLRVRKKKIIFLNSRQG